MTTIVMNTLSGAVTEYDWTFQSLTPAHAGDATGLYVLGGSTDAGQSIESSMATAKKPWGASLKKSLAGVYFSMTGDAGDARMQVHGANSSWDYDFPVRLSGVSRAMPGRGIRENYLSVGFRNIQGRDFAIDRIEVAEHPSKNRRI